MSVVRVGPATHDYPRNRSILHMFRYVAAYRLQPPPTHVSLLWKSARKHVPLELTNLVSVSPLKFVAAAALNHPGGSFPAQSSILASVGSR